LIDKSVEECRKKTLRIDYAWWRTDYYTDKPEELEPYLDMFMKEGPSTTEILIQKMKKSLKSLDVGRAKQKRELKDKISETV